MLKTILSLALPLFLSISTWVMAMPPAIATPSSPMPIAALPIINGLFAGKRPTNLGVKDGKLAPCPTSPNCVVSQGTEDTEHTIAPLQYTGDKAVAMDRLATVISNMERTQIIQKTNDYLYAEFTSKLMGYVDDVEFYFDPAAPVIHVRSASRLGESDLGVNRKRVEAIRSQFNEAV